MVFSGMVLSPRNPHVEGQETTDIQPIKFKMKKLLTITASFAFATAAMAQLPVSRSAGVLPITIKGNGAFTTVAVPFTQEPVARDVVDSVSGNVITGAAGGYTFAITGSTPHSAVILTGSNRGAVRRITASTANSITLSSAVGGLVNGADEFYVVPNHTLGTLFTTGTNPSGLTSNANAAAADIVYLDDDAGNLVQYFHNGTQWRRVSPSGVGTNAVVGINNGCIVLRRAVSDLTFVVKGVVPTGRQTMDMVSGFNIVSYPSTAPTTSGTSFGTTLGNSGLSSVVTGNANSALADIVYIPDASGSLVQYFYNTTQWRRVSPSGNATNVAVLPGNALIINKRSTSASWNVQEGFYAGQ